MKVSKHVEKLLRQGRNPKELVELGFPKSVVTRVRRQLRKEKAVLKGIVPEGTAEAESHPQVPAELPEKIAVIEQRLLSMADSLQKVDTLTEAMSEVTALIAAAREFGTSKRAACLCHEDGLCWEMTWTSQDEIPPGIGEPVARGDEKPEWYIKPSPFYCAMCTAPLEERMDCIDRELSDDPLSGARYAITCEGCGGKGWIAVAVKCTKCGRETYRGWYPKKE